MNPRRTPPIQAPIDPALLRAHQTMGDQYLTYVQNVMQKIDTSKELMELRQWAIEQANLAASRGIHADADISDLIQAAELILAFVAKPLWDVIEDARAEAKKKGQQ